MKDDYRELKNIDAEAGVIATLIVHPAYIFYSDVLRSEHFSDKGYGAMYYAVGRIADSNVTHVDSYNITEYLHESTTPPEIKVMAESLDTEVLNMTISMAPDLARNSVEEYKLIVSNVVDMALRRQTVGRLEDCINLCHNKNETEIPQKVYDAIDNVMADFSTKEEVPAFKDVVDDCWAKLQARQKGEVPGIPFKFKKLNEYAVLEPGELFIFGAGAKQGKSIMLLNCAVDLLKQGKSVLYIDSELNTDLFFDRMLTHLAYDPDDPEGSVTFRKLLTKKYDDRTAVKIDRIRDWMKEQKFTHIYIPMFDIQTIYTVIRQVYHRQGIDVLIIDYFKSTAEGDAWNTYAELGRFVDFIKNRVCGEMGIAGLGAAQANAQGYLADSSKIGRNASTIALITEKTQDEIDTDGPDCGNKKLRVVLNRNGMQHAHDDYIDLRFDGNHILYEEAHQHGMFV